MANNFKRYNNKLCLFSGDVGDVRVEKQKWKI